MTTNNKGKEYASKQYYYHGSYVPVYYYIYIGIEEWIANTIFRGDLSRVFMASSDYAFRRRFELTDMSKSFDELEVASLRFPFANFWPQNDGWKKDNRPAANPAVMLYSGMEIGNTSIRAASMIHSIPVTFYFDREDDARLAYDILSFYIFNKHYYSTQVPYSKGNTLAVPVNITIENLRFNPKYKESDWLKQNRIFTIEANFNVSSYSIYPGEQPNYKQKVNIDGYITDEDGNVLKDSEGTSIVYDDGLEEYYTVDTVILNLANNMSSIFKTYDGFESFPEEGEFGIYYIDSSEVGRYKYGNDCFHNKIYTWVDNSYQEVTEVDLQRLIGIDASSIGVSGVIEESDITLNYLRAKNVRVNSATIAWEYGEDFDKTTIEAIELYINNDKESVELDGSDTEYKLKNLSAGSRYSIKMVIYTNDGKSKSFYLTFMTSEITEKSSKKLDKASLIGYEW